MAETSIQVLQETLDETLKQMSQARAALRHLYAVNLDQVSLKAHATAQHGEEEVDNWYDPEDEGAPFFTEAYLYSMLGKEEARTVLSLVKQVGRALGMDECDLR